MANRSRRGGRGRRRPPQQGSGGGPSQNPPPLVPNYPDERWGDAAAPPPPPPAHSAGEDDDNRGNLIESPAPPRREEPRRGRGEGQREAQGQGRGRRRRGGRGRKRGGQGQGQPQPQHVAVAAPTPAAVPPAVNEPFVQPADLPEGTSPDFAPEVGGRPQGAPKQPRGVVVLTIGLPGSGKSTWFKRRGVTPLSSDTLRTILFDDITEQRYQHLVFSTLRSLLRARLIARMPWNYVDATNLSPKDRKHWVEMARSFGYEAHAVFFDVPLEVCLERNRRRERRVDEDVMQRMAAKLRPPTFEEGFAKITVVRVKRAGEEPAG